MPLRLSTHPSPVRNAHPVRHGILIAALLLVIIWLGFLIIGLAGKVYFTWSIARDTQRQAAVLHAREETLKKNIAALNTPQGREAAIRTAFGVARPGEQVIIVVPPHQAATSTATGTSWWQRLFGWIRL